MLHTCWTRSSWPNLENFKLRSFAEANIFRAKQLESVTDDLDMTPKKLGVRWDGYWISVTSQWMIAQRGFPHTGSQVYPKQVSVFDAARVPRFSYKAVGAVTKFHYILHRSTSNPTLMRVNVGLEMVYIKLN